MPPMNLGQPTKDEFLVWKEHPVSRWVFLALQTASQAQQTAWLNQSWERGEANPLLLTELRTRADAYDALQASTYEDWCKFTGDEPLAGEQT